MLVLLIAQRSCSSIGTGGSSLLIASCSWVRRSWKERRRLLLLLLPLQVAPLICRSTGRLI
jgi:hypothetical protein